MTFLNTDLKGHGTGTGNGNANPIMSPRTGGHAAFGNRLFSPQVNGHGSCSGNCNGNTFLSPRADVSLSLFSTHQTINQTVHQEPTSAGGLVAAAVLGGAVVAAGVYAAAVGSGSKKEKQDATLEHVDGGSTLVAQMMRTSRQLN